MKTGESFNWPYAAIEEALANAVYHKGYDEKEPKGSAYGGNHAGYSAPEGYAPYAPKAKKSKKPLIIGISIAAAAVVMRRLLYL